MAPPAANSSATTTPHHPSRSWQCLPGRGCPCQDRRRGRGQQGLLVWVCKRGSKLLACIHWQHNWGGGMTGTHLASLQRTLQCWPSPFSFFASGSHCTTSVYDLRVSGFFPWRERELHPQFSQSPMLFVECYLLLFPQDSFKRSTNTSLTMHASGEELLDGGRQSSLLAIRAVKVTRCSQVLPSHHPI